MGCFFLGGGEGREPVAIKCRFINKVLFYIYIYI